MLPGCDDVRLTNGCISEMPSQSAPRQQQQQQLGGSVACVSAVSTAALAMRRNATDRFNQPPK